MYNLLLLREVRSSTNVCHTTMHAALQGLIRFCSRFIAGLRAVLIFSCCFRLVTRYVFIFIFTYYNCGVCGTTNMIALGL